MLAGGRYRVERVLGQGGFGITYEARDTKFKSRVKSVAIKEFFVKDFCNREQEINRIIVATQSKVELVEKLRKKFIDEANALFELEHPGIVRVTDTFEENGTAYYVMEYINGSSLSNIIEKTGSLSEDVALGYMRQAAAALEYLHGQNRLHLDIKPHNIMVDNDGRVVLIDFGVSKQYDEVNGENTSTLLGSTPGYAPIEQSGCGVSEFYPSTDIYSLGATLYKLLTGTTPLPAHQLASGEKLPSLPHSISAATRNAVERAMSLNRNNRPQSISEFLSLLECHSEQKPVISTEHSGGEISNTDDGATVADDDNSHSSEDDKKRPDDNGPKRPFSKVSILILSVASVLLFVALFFIKSCNDSNTAEAEAQQATTIAEQQRIYAERKAQERTDSIAAEQKRKEEDERLAQEAAEKAEYQRLEAEQQRQEQERLAKEAAEKKRKEEEERKRKEEEYAKIHGAINGHEYVDLGLPSGIKWATCNVGATKPEEYGGYYAWGETDEKNNYYWSTYKWCNGSYDTQTKYCTNSSYGTVDNKTTLDPEDDVAHVKWGGSWRMPTKAEQDELRDKCTWTWTTRNGVNGYKVTGPNDNSIFLPAAGCRYGTGANYRGVSGCYWSSSLLSYDSGDACDLYFSSDYRGWGDYGRYDGRSVRPVSK